MKGETCEVRVSREEPEKVGTKFRGLVWHVCAAACVRSWARVQTSECRAPAFPAVDGAAAVPRKPRTKPTTSALVPTAAPAAPGEGCPVVSSVGPTGEVADLVHAGFSRTRGERRRGREGRVC